MRILSISSENSSAFPPADPLFQHCGSFVTSPELALGHASSLPIYACRDQAPLIDSLKMNPFQLQPFSTVFKMPLPRPAPEAKSISLPRRSLNPNASSGFTLVELLVVILIIAVLATLAIFATQNIKQKAYQTKALNSIRQISTGNVAFSIENNADINVLLDVSDPRIAGAYITKNYWGQLAPYIFSDVELANNAASGKQIKMRLNSLFATPDASLMTNTTQQGVGVYHDGSGLPLPLSFSNYVYQWNKYLKTTSFDDPSNTIYMTYGFYRFNENHTVSYVAMPKKGSPRGSNNIDYLSSKVGIFSFLDGHVEVLSPPILKRRFTTTP